MANMAVFPLHFWLPDAYAEASTQGSMLLSGVLTKFGAYGMLIFFGTAGIIGSYAPYMAALAAGSAIYAAFMMIRQKELKRVVAYSSMMEMGIVMFAILAANSVATSGAVYAMFAQGLAMALAFLAVGVIKSLFDETNVNRLRDVLSGARSTTYAFALSALAMVGFPLTAGFIAEIMVFFGAVQAFGIYGLVPLVAILLSGAYFYSIISNCFLSRSRPSARDGLATVSQRFGLYALSAVILVSGVLPFLVLGLLRV
jgi:NAD(P)H-quinone oxidoreductase subunit 4